MNKRQKEVQQAYLDNEKEVLNKLKECYRDALADINQKIELLLARQDADMQHVIYQVEYQEALKKQVSAILDTLQTEEFENVSEYLTKSYEEGFLGTMYDLQGQGIPLIFPIDQKQVLDAVQHDTKLSVSLYSKMGKDIHTLKNQISSEISRGIAGAAMYAEIARNISAYANIPMNNAMRIVRTEANRIQNRAALDAQFKAKEKGADVVKQWSAALDDRTRASHRELDGQIRELEEEFEVNGHKAMYPGGFGIASEDINCRCCINQRARWNLQSEEYKYSKAAGEVVSIKSDVYKEWKGQYNEVVKGLSAGKRILSGTGEHEPPKYIGQIDFHNKEEVNHTINLFETRNRAETYEKALVIMADGNIYECYGTAQDVYPNVDLGDKIIGAIITHNHPSKHTEYSFSKYDCSLFEKYHLQVLRGVDEKYEYELTRLNDTVDELKSIFDFKLEIDSRHEMVMSWAAKRGYGYSRRRIDD